MLELDFVGRKSIDANIYYIKYQVMLCFCTSHDSSLVEHSSATQTSRVRFPGPVTFFQNNLNFLLKVRRTLGNARPCISKIALAVISTDLSTKYTITCREKTKSKN